MKVYVLLVTDSNTQNGETDQTYILGVFKSKQVAQEEMEKDIQVHIDRNGFVNDENGIAEKDNTIFKIIFYAYQENWDNYIEYRIEERELE